MRFVSFTILFFIPLGLRHFLCCFVPLVISADQAFDYLLLLFFFGLLCECTLNCEGIVVHVSRNWSLLEYLKWGSLDIFVGVTMLCVL